jgi:hypothetical protein
MSNKKRLHNESETDTEESPEKYNEKNGLESFDYDSYHKIICSFHNAKIDDPILVLKWNHHWTQENPLGIYLNTF